MITKDLSILKKLAIFSIVVDAGSFAGAAKKMGTSRSRVSEQISELEAAIDIRLMHRTPRSLSLTPEGESIYLQSQQLHSLLENVHQVTDNNNLKGRIRITATHDVAVKCIAKHLVDFNEQHPEIEIDFVLSDAKLNFIDSGIDFGIRVGMPRDDSMVGRVLLEQRPLIMASPCYLEKFNLLHTSKETVENLTDANWVLLKQMSPNNEVHLFDKDKKYTVRPKKCHVSDSPIFAHTLVSSGMGLGLFLPATLQEELRSGLIVPIYPHLKGELLIITLLYPSRKHIPLRVRALMDYLRSQDLFSSGIAF